MPHPRTPRLRQLLPLLGLAVACSLAVAAPAGAATFTASADTYVNEGAATTQYGTGREAIVDGGSDPDQVTYLKFPVSGLTGTVSSAVLRVYVLRGTETGIEARSVASTAWTEAITWSTRPAAGTSVLSRVARAGTGWYEFPVTSAVTGNGTFAFALTSPATDGSALGTREAAQAAQLVVTTATPPPAGASAFEGETMSLPSDKGTVVDEASASGGKALQFWSNATATRTLATARASQVTVRAHGQDCNGAPTFDLTVDGTRVATGVTATTGWKDYTFARELAAGNHTFSISLTNGLNAACNRFFYVDRVVLGTGSTPPPPPPPTPSWNPGAQLPISYSLGSLPANALYVATNGTSSNPGTSGAPLASLASAIAKVPQGGAGTIVVRGGTYRDAGVVIPQGKSVRIVAYPGETPIFDGSRTVPAANWAAEGSLRSTAYTPMPLSDTIGVHLSDVNDHENLTASTGYVGRYADQAWVGSQQLRQVTSKAAVVDGTFWVGSGRLYVTANDVNRGTMAVSSAGRFLKVSGASSTVEGLRVTRYSPQGSEYGTILVVDPAHDFRMRNVEVSDAPYQAITLAGWSEAGQILRAPKFERVTITTANWLGISAGYVDDMEISDSKLNRHNQFDEFSHSPVSGAIKTGRVVGMKLLRNEIKDNHGHAVWFDQSNRDNDLVGNRITGNTGSAVFYEISDNLLMVDNYVQSPSTTSAALKLAGSSGIKLVNNTIVGGTDPIGMYTDNRSVPGCADPTKPKCNISWSDGRDDHRPYVNTMDWMPRLDLMLNNVIVSTGRTGYCSGSPLLLCITQTNETANRPLETIIHKADPARGIPQTRMDGDVYASAPGSQLIRAGSTFTGLSAFTSAMAGTPVGIAGLEANGKSGSGWANADGTPTQALRDSSGQAVAIPTNAEINQYIPAGTKRYGYPF